MRKLLLYILFAIIAFSSNSNLAIADGDLWDNYGDQNVYGQKAVSNEEFQKALESKKGKKKKDKNIPKGESFQQSNETNAIINESKELPILMVPLDLKVDNKFVIPTGHYQVEGVREDGKTYLKFYQAHYVIAKIPATETLDDFGEKTINFVKILPNGQNHIQVIYGGIDFNAYSIIDIAQ